MNISWSEYHHHNPPPPFNPLARPDADRIRNKVTTSMVGDDFYAGHTREECKTEWRRRYDSMMEANV